MLRKDLADILRSPGSCTHRRLRVHLSPALSQAEFIRAFTEAITQAWEVFIGETVPKEIHNSVSSKEDKGWLCIQTGGSSGAPKWACHDQETIAAAVDGYATHFESPKINANGCLPLYHVSGLMAWLRCALTGGHYQAIAWSDIQAGRLPPVPSRNPPFLSLVPTQLQRLLNNRQPAILEWLRRHKAIHLGGGPSHPELLEQAADARLPLSLSYGMTETAAMVTASRPHEFTAGLRDSGPPLPHAQIRINAEGMNTILIYSRSLQRGYYPSHNQKQPFEPNDLGELSPQGTLSVLGRSDNLIISGGEKINPLEVENIIMGSGQFSDIAVIPIPHSDWGQAVVAVYPAADSPNLGMLTSYLSGRLPSYKHPKQYYPLPFWPRTTTGKINRQQLQQLFQNRHT